MDERLEERNRFHELCERRGWETHCSTCGNGLEDPKNSDYDTFCDFCCCYYNYDPSDGPRERRARREANKREQGAA